jgi:hypothetical protein
MLCDLAARFKVGAVVHQPVELVVRVAAMEVLIHAAVPDGVIVRVYEVEQLGSANKRVIDQPRQAQNLIVAKRFSCLRVIQNRSRLIKTLALERSIVGIQP